MHLLSGLLLLAGLLVSGTVHGGPSGPAQDLPVLRIGIDRDAAPMEYEDNGRPAGFNVDLVNAVAAEAGYRTEFFFLPWPQVLSGVADGSLDLMFALDTPERRKQYRFSKPILEITWRIFVREETVGISRLADLGGRTVAVVRGFASHVHLLDSGLDIRIVETGTVPEALSLLARGDVLAFFGQYHLASYYIQKNDYENIKSIGEVVDTKPFAIASARRQTALMARIAAALQKVRADGRYRQIKEKWYGFEFSGSRGLLKRLLPFALGGAVLFGMLAAWTVTLRRQVRKQTRQISAHLEKFRLFTERAPFPVVISCGERIEYFNPRFSELLGYEAADLPDMEAWFRNAYPDEAYRAAVISDWVATLGNSEERTKLPKEFDVRSKNGETYRLAFRLIDIDDGRSIVIMEDVGERQRREEERLRAQQLQSIALLAGGIAHDFNNILMQLLGHVNLLQQEEALAADFGESLNTMEKSITRATGITTQLLTFSKGGSPLKKAQSIKTIIEESVDFVLHGSNCTATTRFDKDLPDVEIDGSQFSQVFNNLFINAIQAMPAGGTITITADAVGGGATRGIADRCLRLRIEDTGTGIDQQFQDRVFSPYFSSKPEGHGLGLATSYSIVTRHGGWIGFESQPGRGTTFTILLPALAVRSNGTPDAAKSEMPPVHKRVLVMDDEPAIRDILTRMLKKLGCEVTATNDGTGLVEAYRIAFAAQQPFELVISDLTVRGGMGGREALAILRRFDPGIRAVVSSGFSTDMIPEEFRNEGFVGVLLKPYTFSRLESLIREIFPSG